MRIQDTWDTLRRNWSSRPPIDDVAAFDTVENALGQNLPANYKAFLMESNGGETLEPLPHIRLYGLEELRPSESPDVLEIASGSADAYGFDLSVNRDSAYYPVVKYQLGDPNRTRRRRVSRHFGEFLSQIAAGKELEWRARIDISRSSADRSSLHFCDQPEDSIGVQEAWGALRRFWSSDQPINDRFRAIDNQETLTVTEPSGRVRTTNPHAEMDYEIEQFLKTEPTRTDFEQFLKYM